MRLHMRAVEQHFRRRAARGGQGEEGVLPNALVAPAHEPIVERLGRTVGRSGVLPAAAGLQNLDDAADHPAVVDPSHAARVCRKERLKPLKLRLRQPESAAHLDLPPFGRMNQISTPMGIPLWVPALELYPYRLFVGLFWWRVICRHDTDVHHAPTA